MEETMADGSQQFAPAQDSDVRAPGAGALVGYLGIGPRLDVIGNGAGPGMGSPLQRTPPELAEGVR